MLRLVIALYVAASIVGGLLLGLMADSATYPELITAISTLWVHPEGELALWGAYALSALPAFVAWLVPASGFAPIAIGGAGTIIAASVLAVSCGIAWLSFVLYPALLTMLSTSDHRD